MFRKTKHKQKSNSLLAGLGRSPDSYWLSVFDPMGEDRTRIEPIGRKSRMGISFRNASLPVELLARCFDPFI